MNFEPRSVALTDVFLVVGATIGLVAIAIGIVGTVGRLRG